MQLMICDPALSPTVTKHILAEYSVPPFEVAFAGASLFRIERLHGDRA